jgi:hypothetical protein
MNLRRCIFLQSALFALIAPSACFTQGALFRGAYIKTAIFSTRGLTDE